MRRADGKAVRFDSLMVENDAMRSVVTLGVVEGNDGDIWVASGTHGVIRLHCDASSGEWKLQAYSSRNHKLNNDYVDCLHRDAHGRLWAGTGGSGLNYYDKESDSFYRCMPDGIFRAMLLPASGTIRKATFGWERMPGLSDLRFLTI